MIEIIAATPFATVQDSGRDGYRAQGVSLAGAMDRQALALGNALLGNDPGAAGIETSAGPLHLRFGTDTCIALTGAAAVATLDGDPVPFGWCMAVRAGQVLDIGAPKDGMWSYLCLSGGLGVPKVLGSASTDRKIGLGGPAEGAPLRPGQRLDCGPVDPRRLAVTAELGGYGLTLREGAQDPDGARRIRVLPAREYGCFTPQARALFWSTPWTVGQDSNRVGYRLSGETLALAAPLSLPSYGLVPGTVQVPAGGQPIVQLSEANTCGGYPKIGVVIEADQPALVQARPGRKLRFVQTDLPGALSARQDMRAELIEAREIARKMLTWI
ncbi:5-oxoprolinase/urea amidolyase family protein [Pseudooceanicola sp. GBMRC 2024]|uniref:5-oxoprolinase/urea amidolyase family protein n=1 Tax=Pseudooceanicola albus TaxID=2692189 RepID=A0A6L7G303_9RHOB|nr:biotin-dependent carboxyltransferase family protein [Pseudooceanicola albus]MXN17780.1 5-oxoprolinase/urea amidolyase family protein [Pseudooceanicola albus]